MLQMGCPILGDRKYAGDSIVRQFDQIWRDNKSIALCATNISFKSATDNKQINLSIDVPKEWERYL